MPTLAGYTTRPPPQAYISNYAANFKVGASAAQAGTVDRVHLTALYAPRSFKTFEIGAELTTGSAANNIRIGIYQHEDPMYETDTPQTAVLLYDSGDISAATSGLKQHTVTPNVQIKAGYFWLALATSDATMAFRRLSTSVTNPTGEDIFGCRYALGAFGAFTNPCPAVTSDDTCNFVTYAMVQNDTWG